MTNIPNSLSTWLTAWSAVQTAHLNFTGRIDYICSGMGMTGGFRKWSLDHYSLKNESLTVSATFHEYGWDETQELTIPFNWLFCDGEALDAFLLQYRLDIQRRVAEEKAARDSAIAEKNHEARRHSFLQLKKEFDPDPTDILKSVLAAQENA
jgi:hypothetical protein